MEFLTRLTSAFVLAGLIPLTILFSRDRLRQHRRSLLVALEGWVSHNTLHRMPSSFEVARIKYELSPRSEPLIEDRESLGRIERGSRRSSDWGSWRSFLLPAVVYSLLSALGFTTALFLAADNAFWQAPNFILSGMQSLASPLPTPALAVYQWNSGAAITAGFMGAYLFTLQYLVQRVRSYELSPTSFLIASVSILEACFVVVTARHLTASAAPSTAFTPIAFILGYFPTFGLVWLAEQLRLKNLKRTSPEAYAERYVLPTDMIDGVDSMTKFRLVEAGVYDVQNLATANPVLLYVETPYNLITILDWIAQAQLIVVFGGEVAAKLRRIGVRSIVDFNSMRGDSGVQAMILDAVWPDLKKQNASGDPVAGQYDVLIAKINSNIHVRRLRRFNAIMVSLVDPDAFEFAPAADPKTAAQSQKAWEASGGMRGAGLGKGAPANYPPGQA